MVLSQAPTVPPSPPPGVCVFCHDPGAVQRPPVPATATYTDVLGFSYRLCGAHHRALVAGLRKAERSRPTYGTARRRAPAVRGRRTPGPTCTGAQLRAARQRLGWSIRRLADAFGCTYGHLQAAETGRTHVDPVVAAWVLRVRSPEGYPGQEDEEGALARR